MKPSLYGKYPGKLKYDANYLKNCSEMELFIQVNAFYEPVKFYNEKNIILKYFNKMKKFYKLTCQEELENYFDKKIQELENRSTRTMEELESDEWTYSMDFCILQTARFGTKVTYNPNGRIILTDEFKDWYNNWQSYITNMDSETLSIYRTCRYEGKYLDRFNLDKPSISEDIIEDIDVAKPYTYKLTQKSIKQSA